MVRGRDIVSTVMAYVGVACATPAAADETDKGLLIGLGLTAATGKTTLGEGAGAIEAALLNQEALQQTGAIIVMVTEAEKSARKSKSSVIVMSRSDTLDLTLPTTLVRRLIFVEQGLSSACRDETNKPKAKVVRSKDKLDNQYLKSMEEQDQEPAVAEKPGFYGGSIRASDILGAAMIERAISGVTISSDDRQIVNAVLLNRQQAAGGYSVALNSWNVWKNFNDPTFVPVSKVPVEARRSVSAYRAYGDPQELQVSGSAYKAFERLEQSTMKWRADCPAYNIEKAKGWFEVANATLSASMANDKGPSLLSTAAQAENLRGETGASPFILRVGIEHAGGTAISRTGLLYALGLPGAATVGAGLVTSFRLVDGNDGQLLRQGIIRCAVRQTNVRRVPELLGHAGRPNTITQPERLSETVCDFRVA